jgi:hypothetical protein
LNPPVAPGGGPPAISPPIPPGFGSTPLAVEVEPVAVVVVTFGGGAVLVIKAFAAFSSSFLIVSSIF